MPMPLIRRTFIGLCVASLCAAAAAQSGTVKLEVGFPAGGAGDIIARLVGEKIAVSLGTTVIVENKPGAGGRIAADLLRNAPADGNTVLITPPAPIVIAPYTFRKLPYNPETDFQPVAQLVQFPLVMATGANTPYKSLADVAARFKADPKQATFGTPAAGSQLHFLGLMFGQAIKVDMVHVPYQGGSPLVTDLIGGQIPVGIDQFVYEFHKTGKLRFLAQSGANRSPLMPDVPTFKEQGFPTVVGEAWFGAFVPAKTPAAAVQRLSDALTAAVKQPDVKEKLAAAGLEATGVPAPEFAKLVAADRARWKPVVEASGFRGD
jgi:tripartite-type tricarboxylate transporter receptor subunit TctC